MLTPDGGEGAACAGRSAESCRLTESASAENGLASNGESPLTSGDTSLLPEASDTISARWAETITHQGTNATVTSVRRSRSSIK